MKSKPFGALFGLLALVAILGVAPVFGQTANEIDIAVGAGGSANAACVAANNCFAPNPLTVTPGTTVTWKNTDTVSHYVTSGKVSDNTTGTVFDSGNLIKPGGTYQFTFAAAGTFDYFCSVHPWMTGQVIVSGAAATSTQSTGPTQTGSMNVTASPSSGSTQAGSMSGAASQPDNSTTQANNVQPTTSVNTQYTNSAPVINTASPASDGQTSAWVAGIIIVAIMSSVGIWSTVRRK